MRLKKVISAVTLGVFLSVAAFSGNGFAETPAATPSGSAAASPSATSAANSRRIVKYDTSKPFFMQDFFSQDFDEHTYSYKRAESTWVLVNKVRPLDPQTYKPSVIKPAFTKPSVSNPASQKLRVDAANALVAMDRAMYKEIGARIRFASGYRSYTTQKAVHNAQVARLGKAAGERLAAREGFSEHQTGLAADISATGSRCYIQVCFGKEKAGIWLANNSWRFGFILRYPNKKTAITGYQYEPWHFRFIGEALAGEYHYLGATTLEHFLGAGIAPAYDGPVNDEIFFY